MSEAKIVELEQYCQKLEASKRRLQEALEKTEIEKDAIAPGNVLSRLASWAEANGWTASREQLEEIVAIVSAWRDGE